MTLEELRANGSAPPHRVVPSRGDDVARRESEIPDTQFDVTPRELRGAKLPLQPFGGYSRADTDQLLERAAGALEEKNSSLQKQVSDLQMALDEARRMLAYQASREPSSVEQAVGDVLVTAHHAAEVLRNEANEEADNLLAEARQQARTIVAEAERQLQEVDAAKVQAERAVAKLHAKARRVHLVIDEFRTEWWNLISEALKQLELRVPTAGAPVEE